MTKLSIIAFLSVVCVCGAATPTASQLKSTLQKCVDKQHRAPGMVAGMIDKDGVTVVGWGKMGDENSPEVNGDTLFEIGSMTKVFTGLLLQDMADHGELQLDDPASKYLPSTVTMPSRNDKQITLRQLATHTSGLPRLPNNLKPADDENPYADYTVQNLYAFLSKYQLRRNPGAKSEYSNLGMGLLGHILALKAGTNYETLVINRICDPLKLSNTRITIPPAWQSRFAEGHGESGASAEHWDIPTLAGCGALRSTANDILRLLAAEMGLAPSPLSGAMEKTQQAQKGTGMLEPCGLAWQIDRLGGLLWHNGGTGGFRSYMGFTKDKTLGVVVLANSANDVDDVGQFLLGDVNSIDKITIPKQHKVVKIDPAIYDRYVGEYKLGFGAMFTITRDGDKLMAKLSGQDTYQVYPESATDFFYTVVDAQLTFATNSAGDVTHLVLHQNGLDQKAKKTK